MKSPKRLCKTIPISALILCFALCLDQYKPAAALARGAGESSDQQLIEGLRGFIPQVMRQNGTPGLNIALARRGNVIWDEGFGYADLEKRIPMTRETVMRAGSMSKTYTATAVMQLVERGVFHLDDPINKYLTDIKAVNSLGDREITFSDLLTHRSGLTGDTAGCEFVAAAPLAEYIKEGYAKQTFESYKGSLPRWSAKVGEKVLYSNFGLATLGYLVQATNPEGLSFSDFVGKHIIDPLGMTSTQYPAVQDASHIRPDILKRLSTGYAKFGSLDIPTPPIYIAAYPAGSLVTIPRDHIRLLLAYLNNGLYNGYRLLCPESVELMLTPHVPYGQGSLGLVWFLYNWNKYNWNKEDFSYGHGGAYMYGWNNEFLAYPNQDFAIVVATNHWDLANPQERSLKREVRLISNFVSSWIKNEKRNLGRRRQRASWAWETSYVIGLMMVESLKGSLGIESPLISIDRFAGSAINVQSEVPSSSAS